MKSTYDFVVIGAGPAGLMIAKELSSAKQDVLLVDIKKDIPVINRSCCTMLINEPNTHGDTATIVDNNIHFEKTGFTVRYTGQWVKMERSIRLSPGGKKITMVNEKEGVARPYSKDVLLKGLLEDVVANGVDILTETAGIRAENIDGGVKVILRGTRSRTLKEVRCKIAFAADGVNSQITRCLELAKKRTYFGSFHVASYFLEGVENPYPNSWVTFVGQGHTKWGRGQLYFMPKHLPTAKFGDEPIIDIMCGSPIGFPAKLAVDHFMRKGNFAPWFRNAKIVHSASAVLNFYTCVQEPVEGNIVVVGDAASFIETYCQSAMVYGYRAAHAALKVLATGSGYDDYSNFWRESFEYCWPGEIEKALRGFGLHMMSDAELDYIFGLTDSEEYPGYVSENSAPEVMKHAIMSHIEQIRKEKPDIAEKIEKHWTSASATDIVRGT
jgi:flavin-dependent dehydrogenase